MIIFHEKGSDTDSKNFMHTGFPAKNTWNKCLNHLWANNRYLRNCDANLAAGNRLALGHRQQLVAVPTQPQQPALVHYKKVAKIFGKARSHGGILPAPL